MLKRYLFKDLDTKVMSFSKVIDEIRRKNLTGFLRVVYWTRDEYLLIREGEPYKVVIFNTDGTRQSAEPDTFKLGDEDGTASLAETTVDDLVAIAEYRHNPKMDGSIIFFPHGTPIQEPISVSFLDVNREFLLAQRSHLDGYMALYSEEEIFGLVVFQGGLPVAVFAGDGSYGQPAISYINAHLIPAKSFMSMYALEPELLSFMYSMHDDNIIELDLQIKNYSEAREYISKGRRSAIVVIESEGISRYDLFFRGQLIESLVKDKGVFLQGEDKERLSVKVENLPDRTIKLYEVSLIEKPNTIDVVIEVTSEEVVDTSPEVPLEKVTAVKSEFIRDIGPIGKLIWEKTLEEYGFKESSMNLNQLKIVVERLRKEFPEEDMSKEFMRKIEDILPDII
ncbi:MAG: hypothetical protein GXO18_07980 [Aquificae bacterium]|nr:hypothetical protein [Aquificota bacterium]